jgi:hypothetical protein
MVSMLPLRAAHQLSCSRQGVYAVVYGLTIAVVIWNRKRRPINFVLLIAISMLFLLCTVHIVLRLHDFDLVG